MEQVSDNLPQPSPPTSITTLTTRSCSSMTTSYHSTSNIYRTSSYTYVNCVTGMHMVNKTCTLNWQKDWLTKFGKQATQTYVTLRVTPT